MARDRIGFGVIGCGVIADLMYFPHLQQRYRDCQLELVAVCDAVEEKAVRALRVYGAGRYYTSYRELLEDPDVDAVIVATNIASHGEIALAAARAGKHLLVQKPIAESLEDADRIVEAARASCVKLQVEPAHMLNPLCVRARQAIDSGALGKVCMVQALSAHGGAEDRPWLFQRSGGGSVMMDMAVHAITWLVSLVGPVERVTSFARTSVPVRVINGQPLEVDIDDNVVVLLEFRSGALGTVVSNYVTIANQAPGYSVYGTDGTLHIQSPQAPFTIFSRKAEYLGEQGWLTPTFFGGHRYQPVRAPIPYDSRVMHPYYSLAHFADCLIDDTEPVPSGAVARHVLEIMIRASESARTGQAQGLGTGFEMAPAAS